MLDREYELAPIFHGGQRKGSEISGWNCQAVADPSELARSSAAAAARVPLKESNGLLWAWPDTSPEGGLNLLYS